MNANGHRDPLTNRRYFVVLLGFAAAAIVIGFVFRRLTIPILGGLFLAYLGTPIVKVIERRTKMGNVAASLILIISILGLLIFGIFQIVPLVYVQISEIVDLVPEAFKLIELKWLPLLKQSVAELGFPEFVAWLDNLSLNGIVRQLGNRSGMALEQLWMATPSVLGQIFNVLLIPFVSLFVLIERNRIAHALLSVVPSDTKTSINALVHRLDSTLSAIIVGQLIIAAIMGILYMIGLSAIGLGSGVAIGVIAGICRLVPYLDLIVGVGLSLIVILTEFSSWSQLFAMFSVFLAVQTIDGMLLTPKIIGNRVGLHPLVVVMAVIAFGDWFGFSGVLLALPVVAVVSVLVSEFVTIYKQSKFYAASSAD